MLLQNLPFSLTLHQLGQGTFLSYVQKSFIVEEQKRENIH